MSNQVDFNTYYSQLYQEEMVTIRLPKSVADTFQQKMDPSEIDTLYMLLQNRSVFTMIHKLFGNSFESKQLFDMLLFDYLLLASKSKRVHVDTSFVWMLRDLKDLFSSSLYFQYTLEHWRKDIGRRGK